MLGKTTRRLDDHFGKTFKRLSHCKGITSVNHTVFVEVFSNETVAFYGIYFSLEDHFAIKVVFTFNAYCLFKTIFPGGNVDL